MLRTLQWYISRELAKSFTLTAIGLGLVFSLTGSVLNMIQAEALTTIQMLHLMSFILPLSLTLTLPVSALFACAMVYGRLASDNEFDACKASGVNIQRLLLPAFVLSVFTGAFTFVSGNYLLPHYVKRLEELVAKDPQKILTSALNMRGYIKVKDSFIIHAGELPVVENGPDRARVRIGHAAFLEIENETLMKAGTTGEVVVDFWSDPRTGDPIAEAAMSDVRAFDFRQSMLVTSSGSRFDPIAVPMFSRQKAKWLNLSDLLYYRHHPAELFTIKKQLHKLREQFRDALLYEYVVKELNGGDRMLALKDENERIRYEIRADQAAHDPLDFGPRLAGVSVRDHRDGHVRDWRAESCSIKLGRGFGTAPLVVHIRLTKNVSFTDTQDPQRKRVNSTDTDLDPVPVPPDAIRLAAELSDLELLDIDAELVRQASEGKIPEEPPPYRFKLGNRIEGARDGLLKEIGSQALEVAGLIHSRFAFSVSSLVMLVLAAALAIIFRGGQLLTAFVISFIPGLLVVVMNIAGRQLAEKPDTHLAGIGVIWAAIVLVAVADAVVLTRFLRR